ncbi:hypothetical protein GX411_01790 [Candidatus Fermentibacteria bacterium]|nr:hypothetical protein [Candidatus Fermentibacteria bacterium]
MKASSRSALLLWAALPLPPAELHAGGGGPVIDEALLVDEYPFCGEYGVHRIPVEDFPSELLPPCSESLDLIPIRSADSIGLLAAAANREGWMILDTLTCPGSLNTAKSWAWWDGEKRHLVFATQVSFRMFTFFSEWRGDGCGFPPRLFE